MSIIKFVDLSIKKMEIKSKEAFMKIKILIAAAFCGFGVSAGAISLSGILQNDKAREAASAAASKVVAAVSPEEQVRRLIDKCTTPTTDGICECVANAVVANLTPEQWKTVNKYMFDTRREVSTTEFLLKNPWIVPKLAAPYTKCSDKK